MWNCRNEVKFEKVSEKDPKAHSIADTKIAELLNQAPPQRMLTVAERRIFLNGIEFHRTKPLKAKTRWMCDASVILQRFNENVDKETEHLNAV